MHLRIYIAPSDPTDRPARMSPPQIFVDDMPTRSFETEYASYADAISASHTVELRAGEVVVASMSLGSAEIQDCSAHYDDEPVIDFMDTLCEYDNGELAYESSEGSTASGGCQGDAFCTHGCGPCSTGMHCTSRAVLIDPLYTHLGCAPIGPKQLGDACELIMDPNGAYDDCADGLLCVAGTCHTICQQPTSPQCSICEYVDGEPSELKVCE